MFQGDRPLHFYRAARNQQYSVPTFAASSELSSLAWVALFVLQRCTILLKALKHATATSKFVEAYYCCCF
jgi:hypothetical protein